MVNEARSPVVLLALGRKGQGSQDDRPSSAHCWPGQMMELNNSPVAPGLGRLIKVFEVSETRLAKPSYSRI